MSAIKGGVYQRGPYWLDFVRGADGQPASARWYIWWYDAAAGRQQRRSTRTSDIRIACDALDQHFLATHRSTPADQEAYSVHDALADYWQEHDALADYWQEHGRNLPSADPIKARIKLLVRFLTIEADAGRIARPILPEHIDDRLLDRFRAWGIADPIVARRKDADGQWVDGKSRARSPSTVEESVIQLKAALNHAFRARRTRYVPPLAHKTRDQVTPQRTYRLSIDGIAELLDYSLRGAGKYAGHGAILMPLRRYLIAAICTLARPDAILDMSVAPIREQWLQQHGLFALNPAGRIQTKKVRPIVPVVPLLANWLETTHEWFVCRESEQIDKRTGQIVTTQSPVDGIRSGWTSARAQLGIPDGWGPKLIRHSMATILANKGVDLIQLEMALGHRVLSKTSSRYAIFDPGYLATVRSGLDDVISELTRKAGPALHAKLTQKDENVTVLRA